MLGGEPQNIGGGILGDPKYMGGTPKIGGGNPKYWGEGTPNQERKIGGKTPKFG